MNYKFPLLAIASVSVASAQGLFSTSSDSTLTDQSAIRTTASLQFGYDDNLNPIGSEVQGEESSAFISANLRASYAEVRSNASLSAYADLGVISYFEDDIADDNIVPVINLGVTLGYSLNDRIQLSSNNFVTHGLEPDYERSFANDRRSGQFTSYSTYNEIGVRWSQRFGTKHGFGIQGAEYERAQGDYQHISFRNELRYRLNDRTVLKGAYTFGLRPDTDTNFHRYEVGFEHSLSERTGIDFTIGGNTIDRDNGFNRTALFVNGAVSHTASDRLNFRGYVRYGIDDIFLNLGNDTFQARETLRLGLNFNYTLNQKVSYHGGISVISTDYIESTTNGSDQNTWLYNINLGMSYSLSSKLSATLNYNFTQSLSDDIAGFEYKRNRYSLGLQYAF